MMTNKVKPNWEQKASILWPALVDAAKSRTTVHYGDIAPLIGYQPSFALPVRYSLGLIQNYCWDNDIPKLTAVVVSKVSGEPGSGFAGGDLTQVYDYNWTQIQNPFELSETEEHARALIENPGNASTIWTKLKSRGTGQQVFRLALLKAYGEQCAMCGFSFEEVLEAAHIIPWEECASEEQRVSPNNGILLCANHHKLFDSGWIFVTADYKIESGASYFLSDADKQGVEKLHGKELKLPKNKQLHPDKKLLLMRYDEWSNAEQS